MRIRGAVLAHARAPVLPQAVAGLAVTRNDYQWPRFNAPGAAAPSFASVQVLRSVGRARRAAGALPGGCPDPPRAARSGAALRRYHSAIEVPTLRVTKMHASGTACGSIKAMRQLRAWSMREVKRRGRLPFSLDRVVPSPGHSWTGCFGGPLGEGWRETGCIGLLAAAQSVSRAPFGIQLLGAHAAAEAAARAGTPERGQAGPAAGRPTTELQPIQVSALGREPKG